MKERDKGESESNKTGMNEWKKESVSGVRVK